MVAHAEVVEVFTNRSLGWRGSTRATSVAIAVTRLIVAGVCSSSRPVLDQAVGSGHGPSHAPS